MKRDKNTAIYIAHDDYEPLDIARSERDLLFAVLFSAIADLREPGDIGRKAKEFFLNRDDDYLYSFHSICDFLNLAPNQVMRVIGVKGAKIPDELLEELSPSARAPEKTA